MATKSADPGEQIARHFEAINLLGQYIGSPGEISGKKSLESYASCDARLEGGVKGCAHDDKRGRHGKAGARRNAVPVRPKDLRLPP